MSETTLRSVVRRVESRIATMVPEGGPIVVACSGGKDSLVLAIALNELGLRPTAALVDLGYDNAWAGRVGEGLEQLGITSEVVAPARIERSASTFLATPEQLRQNLTILTVDTGPDQTPCTACYNSKVLLIQQRYGSRNPVPVIAFGHHASDAAASLLKTVFMYMDRWDFDNEIYDRDRFRKACRGHSEKLMAQDESVIARIDEIVSERLASTDEPPVQQLLVDNIGSLRLVRPLVDVWEHEIIDTASELELVPESSGCGHTAAQETQTPREIVLFEVIRKMERVPALRRLLSDWVSVGLDAEGRLVTDTRRRRSELLGSSYKSAPGGVGKL